MRKGTKLGIAAALGVAVIAVSIITAATRDADGVQVRIEAVQRRDLVALVAGTGWIRPHRKVDVQADIMGRITELRVTEGQPVTRGEIMLRIDPRQYEAAVEQ
ncbi:MAG: biotin/lipoyl-binding protein, partial [Longimicrobiales bacterium]